MKLTEYIPVTHDDDDYWTHDIPLFVTTIRYYRNKPRMIQGKIHLSEERYSWGYREIIPLSEKAGARRYVNMHPYVFDHHIGTTLIIKREPLFFAS